VSAEDIPVVAFSVGEEELAGIDTKPLVGHLAAWNYFQSIESEENAAFIAKWKAFIGNDERVTNDPMEATYIGFNMWVQAVKAAGTTNVDAVEQAMLGQTTPNLTGGIALMNNNHHLSKPVLIGEIQDDGQFEVVWATESVVPGDAWSDFLPGSKDLISDWSSPLKCGSYNTVTKVCTGQK
jgi:urea transport system substrate-binding protein